MAQPIWPKSIESIQHNIVSNIIQIKYTRNSSATSSQIINLPLYVVILNMFSYLSLKQKSFIWQIKTVIGKNTSGCDEELCQWQAAWQMSTVLKRCKRFGIFVLQINI